MSVPIIISAIHEPLQRREATVEQKLQVVKLALVELHPLATRSRFQTASLFQSGRRQQVEMFPARLPVERWEHGWSEKRKMKEKKRGTT
jgi:hypothetical protein